MTAAPFNKNPRTKHITNDGNAIRAAGNVLSVLMVKTHFGTGAIYKPSHSFFENIIGHMRSPLENNCHMAWTRGGSNTLTEIFSCLSWS